MSFFLSNLIYYFLFKNCCLFRLVIYIYITAWGRIWEGRTWMQEGVSIYFTQRRLREPNGDKERDVTGIHGFAGNLKTMYRAELFPAFCNLFNVSSRSQSNHDGTHAIRPSRAWSPLPVRTSGLALIRPGQCARGASRQLFRGHGSAVMCVTVLKIDGEDEASSLLPCIHRHLCILLSIFLPWPSSQELTA